MPNAIETRTVRKQFERDPYRRWVSFGGAHTYGLFRDTRQTVEDGGALKPQDETTILIATGSLALVEGSTVRVHTDKSPYSAYTDYTVRDRLRPEDGLTTRYLLVVPTA